MGDNGAGPNEAQSSVLTAAYEQRFTPNTAQSPDKFRPQSANRSWHQDSLHDMVGV